MFPASSLPWDNVVLTPHRASFAHEAVVDLYELGVANLEAFFSHKTVAFSDR